jgi:hypothetical protein
MWERVGSCTVEDSCEARVVPPVGWIVAREQDRRALRLKDQREEELGAGGVLVVDRGRGSGEEFTACAAKERAFA